MNTSPPLTNRVFERPSVHGLEAPGQEAMWLLPATTRTKDHRIVQPRLDLSLLQKELLVKRLDDIAKWLWVCGRPMPPRPLHYQILLSREIFITENVELHLVWSKNRIFIKPLPLYLLDPGFWTTFLSSESAETQQVRKCAQGFLYSYCALVSYESDFRIAQERNLLPSEVTWIDWKQLTAQLLQNDIYKLINPRYHYGELRLSRLNKVYKFRMGRLLRGYAGVDGHREYSEFLGDHFAIIASLLGYCVIVLTAMQVGLQTHQLQYSDAFQSASYGFTVFSIAAPLVAATGILLIALVMFVDNFFATKKFEEKQFSNMDIVPPWKEKLKRKIEQNQHV